MIAQESGYTQIYEEQRKEAQDAFFILALLRHDRHGGIMVRGLTIREICGRWQSCKIQIHGNCNYFVKRKVKHGTY